MIDFKNAAFLKLRPIDKKVFIPEIVPMFASEEYALAAYQGIRDGVVFTNKRIIAINVQGLSGKKKDFTSLPYNRIQAYSVETAGLMDNDTELDLWFSGLGHVRFEFIRSMNVADICRLISEKVL